MARPKSLSKTQLDNLLKAAKENGSRLHTCVVKDGTMSITFAPLDDPPVIGHTPLKNVPKQWAQRE